MTQDVSTKKAGCVRTLGIMLITVVISVTVTIFVINHYLFPKKFDKVELNGKEQSVLRSKLSYFGVDLKAGNNEGTEPGT